MLIEPIIVGFLDQVSDLKNTNLEISVLRCVLGILETSQISPTFIKALNEVIFGSHFFEF